jgi:hypothetical protein
MPGANIEDVSGVRKVMEEMTAMFPHFFFAGQFRALAGSSGVTQSTTFGSDGSAGMV